MEGLPITKGMMKVHLPNPPSIYLIMNFIFDISSDDFTDNIEKTIYHFRFSSSLSRLISAIYGFKIGFQSIKVVLGGQGGDEIFGGYARYVIAYLEQCLSAAIDGNYKDGNYVVTIESIIPNLGLLRNINL